MLAAGNGFPSASSTVIVAETPRVNEIATSLAPAETSKGATSM